MSQFKLTIIFSVSESSGEYALDFSQGDVTVNHVEIHDNESDCFESLSFHESRGNGYSVLNSSIQKTGVN